MLPNYLVEKYDLNTVFNNQIKYIIPNYQRPYVWDREQTETLWNDLMSDYLDGVDNKNDEYLLGTTVTLSRPMNLHEIIDGQQRLVTLTLLFCAIRESVRKYEDEAQADKDIIRRLITKINKLIVDENKNVIIQLIDTDVNATLNDIQLNNNLKQNTKTGIRKPQKLLLKNYKILLVEATALCEKCHVACPDNGFKCMMYKLEDIFDDLCKKTFFISVGITNDTYSHQIFQSLNSTGLGLNQADLIKNYLLKRSYKKEETASLWDSVMKEFDKPDNFLYESLLSRPKEDIKDIRKNNLFQSIKKRCRNQDRINEYILELQLDSEIIKLLNKPEDIPDQYPEGLRHAFYGIKQIGAIHIRRPIIAACRKWGIGNKQTMSLIDCLLKFFFMYRTICEKNVDTLKRICSDVTKQIMYGEELPSILHTILKDTSRDSLSYVEEKEFISMFRANVSGFTEGEIRYILTSLEHKIRKNNNSQSYIPNELVIEYIFPKTPNVKDWPNKDELDHHKDRLGNITLMPKPWSTSTSRLSFKVKKESSFNNDDINYLKSDLDLNKQYLCNYDKWTVNEIKSRERDLCHLAFKVWNLSDYLSQADP